MTNEEFIKRQSKLVSEIPQEFRGAMIYKAYQDGHAYGNEEILIHLSELVEMIKDPVIDYTNRVINKVISGIEDGETIMKMLD